MGAVDQARSQLGDEALGRIVGYLRDLTSYPDRHVGGPGNQAATAMFAGRARDLGFAVDVEQFDCIEWEFGEASIDVGSESFETQVGPYSLPIDMTAPLVAVSSVEELESESVRGKIVLLHGPIASGQVMPKNFTFYNPEAHKRIVRALETFAPAAVVAATGQRLADGGQPVPVPPVRGRRPRHPKRLHEGRRRREAECPRGLARSRFESTLAASPPPPSTSSRRLPGYGAGRVVFTAHIDSRKGSPGALDNASGVATLLALMEFLSDYRGRTHHRGRPVQRRRQLREPR